MAEFGLKEGTQFANAILGLKDYVDDKRLEEKTEFFSQQLQQNPGFTPQGEYDAKAWNQARLMNMDVMLKQHGLEEKALQMKKQNWDWQRQQMTDLSSQAYVYAEKQPKRAKELYEKAYDAAHTGDDLVITDDMKKYVIKDKATGDVTFESSEFESSQELFNHLQNLSQSMANPVVWDRTMMAKDQENALKYANAEPETVIDKDGNIGYKFRNITNKLSGKVEDVYQVNGVEISEEEAQKRGFVPVEEAKTVKEIGLKEAETETERAQGEYYKAFAELKKKTAAAGVGSEGSKHSIEKLAEFYARPDVYGISIKEATEMVRGDLAKKEVGDAITRAVLADPMLLENPEEFKRVREQLIIEHSPTQPGQNFGIPGATKFRGGKKVLDKTTATEFLKQAKGDKNLARKLATEAGYEVK